MIPLDKIDSLKLYVVVVGMALMISEHDTLREARSACGKAIKEGFEGVTVLKRTPRGWERVK